MKTWNRTRRIAFWLVACVATLPLAFPQTPANAASSVAPPIHLIEALEEAAPGVEHKNFKRYWVGAGELFHIIARYEGRWLEFILDQGGSLLWVGPEGHLGDPPEIHGAGLEIGLGDLPLAVRMQAAALEKEFVADSIREEPGDEPVYFLVGEGSRGHAMMRIGADGSILDFEVDTDRDGLGDAFELAKGWDPESRDSDGDGFPDQVEYHRGSDPNDQARNPKILAVRLDRESKVVIASVATFENARFYLETKNSNSDEWRRFGEPILGDGRPHEFAVPLGGSGQTAALLRAGFTDMSDQAPDAGGDAADTGGRCEIPDSLIGRQIVVEGGHRLCFKSKTRGEVVEGQGGGMLVTPFAYTFHSSGLCRARLTLAFNTAVGFDVAIYELTFGSDGRSSGVFIAREYEGGIEEDRFGGIFTISMNP